MQQAVKKNSKPTKNHMLFGTSIRTCFAKGFGRILGGQNPYFFVFAYVFFNVSVKMCSGGPPIASQEGFRSLNLVILGAKTALGGRGVEPKNQKLLI